MGRQPGSAILPISTKIARELLDEGDGKGDEESWSAPVETVTYKATARVVGVLFIVATVTSIVGGSLVMQLRDDSHYLSVVAVHAGQLILGVLLEFVLALSVMGIAALLLPVLRPHGEGMAVGYVARAHGGGSFPHGCRCGASSGACCS
ncbi:MAG: DUF4386 family protein [Candidatus Nanopelagicales bacterium]